MNVRQVIPADAIPSVDDPTFGESYFGDPEDDVIVLDRDGAPARAYPVRILNYHEIVNDQIGGTPVAVTWCPLCGSAVVYDRHVGNQTLTFGVSGKLADDDLVMYDRETGSEWKQSLGEAIAGDLEGAELSVLPARLTTWAQFQETSPDGVVLQRPGGKSEASSDTDEPAPIEYDDEPYGRYFESAGFGLDAHRGEGSQKWGRADLGPKEIVLGIESGGEALGFPLERVRDAGGVVQATVGEHEVVVFATSEGLQAFENPGLAFEPVGPDDDADDGRMFRADGTRWDGATGESEDDRVLERVATQWLFAFAWQDDHGPESFWKPER